MGKRYKFLALVAIILAAIAGLAGLLRGNTIAVLNPAGTIATQQRDLMVIVILLMLIVVLPVFALTFHIGWKYREKNTKAKYTPEADGNWKLETIWWLIPLSIIVVLSVIIWKSSHALDPFKPLESTKQPVKIQVVALNWKWLFIYPEEGIASLNYIQFPEDTPVNFEITSDAPMNSFWIPQLGGQVYAMAGMTTKLHLMADNPESYKGSSANLSGEGFAGMKFEAKSSSAADYQKWTEDIQASFNSGDLSMDVYNDLAKPSKDNPVMFYRLSEPRLYDKIIEKYMTPPEGSHEGMDMSEMEMHH